MKQFVDYDIWVPVTGDKPTVMMILDAGHGGLLNGEYTTAPSKMKDFGDFVFYEGIQNREIVKQLATKFKVNNIAHAFTTISNLDESLDERGIKAGRIKSAYPAYHTILLSIHANAGGGNARGCEYWTTIELNDSDYVANYYFPYLHELGFKVRINREKENEYDKEAGFKILKLAERKDVPAVLFELGFFDNREEALIMLTKEWQDIATTALLKGTQSIIKAIKENGTFKPK